MTLDSICNSCDVFGVSFSEEEGFFSEQKGEGFECQEKLFRLWDFLILDGTNILLNFYVVTHREVEKTAIWLYKIVGPISNVLSVSDLVFKEVRRRKFGVNSDTIFGPRLRVGWGGVG